MNQEPGFLTKLLTLLASVILVVVGFMFSLVFLAVVAAVGLVVWGYFWWKTRELRQAMRERPPGGHVVEGQATVVEGEAVVVESYPDREPHALPQDLPLK
jgi:hypothetical protein